MTNSHTHRGNIIARILDWLRAGYPQGIPHQDHVVLFGLLHRRLDDTEISLVARTLADEGRLDATPQDIAQAVREFAHQEASEDDINRVRGRLAAAGWPLADPNELAVSDDPQTP